MEKGEEVTWETDNDIDVYNVTVGGKPIRSLNRKKLIETVESMAAFIQGNKKRSQEKIDRIDRVLKQFEDQK